MINLFVLSNFLSLFVFIVPLGLWAGDHQSDAEALSGKSGLEPYKKAIELFLKALDTSPRDYDLQWKCARAYRNYAKEAKQERIQGWKDVCAHCGKEGMKWAQRAFEQEPSKSEGYYYFGLNAGSYAEGVSKFTAFKEGLRTKVLHSFEKVYELDKFYDDGGAILALGRYWASVPWPFKNEKKALRYYREYQETEYFSTSEDGPLYLAELLLKFKRKGDEAEAKALLEKVAYSNNEESRSKAKKLLAEIK